MYYNPLRKKRSVKRDDDSKENVRFSIYQNEIEPQMSSEAESSEIQNRDSRRFSTQLNYEDTFKDEEGDIECDGRPSILFANPLVDENEKDNEHYHDNVIKKHSVKDSVKYSPKNYEILTKTVEDLEKSLKECRNALRLSQDEIKILKDENELLLQNSHIRESFSATKKKGLNQNQVVFFF